MTTPALRPGLQLVPLVSPNSTLPNGPRKALGWRCGVRYPQLASSMIREAFIFDPKRQEPGPLNAFWPVPLHYDHLCAPATGPSPRLAPQVRVTRSVRPTLHRPRLLAVLLSN